MQSRLMIGARTGAAGLSGLVLDFQCFPELILACDSDMVQAIMWGQIHCVEGKMSGHFWPGKHWSTFQETKQNIWATKTSRSH